MESGNNDEGRSVEEDQECSDCNGTGDVRDNGTNNGICETCNGTGIYPEG